MLANVLKSKKARKTSVAIVRAFIVLKKFALHYQDIADQLTELEEKYNRQFKDVYEAINYLLQKDQQQTEQQQRKRIGFKKGDQVDLESYYYPEDQKEYFLNLGKLREVGD